LRWVERNYWSDRGIGSLSESRREGAGLEMFFHA
jgi:hypothetical protein